MKVSEKFSGKYLKGPDLKGKTYQLIMDEVIDEKMPDGKIASVLYFTNAEKGVVLNKTNATTIASIYGDDSEAWRGYSISVFNDPTVMFGGERKGGIRVGAPAAAGRNPAPAPVKPEPAPPTDDDQGGDIPF